MAQRTKIERNAVRDFSEYKGLIEEEYGGSQSYMQKEIIVKGTVVK